MSDIREALATGPVSDIREALATGPVSDIREALATGLAVLDDLYVEAIQAYAPPNPQFERDRIIRSLVNKREIAYVCGFLSEGENEAALILGSVREVLDVDPDAETAHLLDEARYYLRTSVDPTWQLDAQTPTVAAALRYLANILARRIARAAAGRVEPALAEVAEPDARALLKDGLVADVVGCGRGARDPAATRSR